MREKNENENFNFNSFIFKGYVVKEMPQLEI